jgi:hypothetical protein
MSFMKAFVVLILWVLFVFCEGYPACLLHCHIMAL